jgi:hypothetical protein
VLSVSQQYSCVCSESRCRWQCDEGWGTSSGAHVVCVDHVSGNLLQSPLLPTDLDDIHLETTVELEHSAQQFCKRPAVSVYLICRPNGFILKWPWPGEHPTTRFYILKVLSHLLFYDITPVIFIILVHVKYNFHWLDITLHMQNMEWYMSVSVRCDIWAEIRNVDG